MLTIGKQIRETLLNHNPKMTKKEANERAIELMRQVGIPRQKSVSISIRLNFRAV